MKPIVVYLEELPLYLKVVFLAVLFAAAVGLSPGYAEAAETVGGLDTSTTPATETTDAGTPIVASVVAEDPISTTPHVPIMLSTPVTPSATVITNGKIAYGSDKDDINGEIYTINPDGTDNTRLTNNLFIDSSPDWSPDGTKIAFYSNRDGNNEIYWMFANGSSPTRLTNNIANDITPQWSPDGTKILFHTNRDGNYEAYVMNADGSDQTNLTNNPAADAVVYDFPSAWSPDGDRIAFISTRSGVQHIYVMDADGTNQVNITPGTAVDQLVAWSATNGRILFLSDRNSPYPVYNVDLYSMDAGGTNITRITTGLEEEDNGDWSPDGQRIVVSVYPNETFASAQLYIMNADGSGRIQLTSGGTYGGYSASWQRTFTVVPDPVPPADTGGTSGSGISVTSTSLDSLSDNAMLPEAGTATSIPIATIILLSSLYYLRRLPRPTMLQY